jgi:hypothetical protein
MSYAASLQGVPGGNRSGAGHARGAAAPLAMAGQKAGNVQMAMPKAQTCAILGSVADQA